MSRRPSKQTRGKCFSSDASYEQGSEAFDGKNTKLWRSFHHFLVILPFFVPYSMDLPMVDEDRSFCETKNAWIDASGSLP